jgi:hypothetical protein
MLSSFKVDIAIEKLKRYKSAGTDHILAEAIKRGRNISHTAVEEIYYSAYKIGDETDYSIYREYQCYHLTYLHTHTHAYLFTYLLNHSLHGVRYYLKS